MESKGMKPVTRDDLARFGRKMGDRMDRMGSRLDSKIDRLAKHQLEFERKTGERFSRLEDLVRSSFGKLADMIAVLSDRHRHQLRTNANFEDRLRTLDARPKLG